MLDWQAARSRAQAPQPRRVDVRAFRREMSTSGRSVSRRRRPSFSHVQLSASRGSARPSMLTLTWVRPSSVKPLMSCPDPISALATLAFGKSDRQDVTSCRRLVRARRRRRRSNAQKNNAAPKPQDGAASMSRRDDGPKPGRLSYFLSCGASSSTTHGQKFCGFRVVAAFLITVIFMSVTPFLVNGRLLVYAIAAAVRSARLTTADSNAPL